MTSCSDCRVVIQLELEEVVNRSMAQPLRMRFTQVEDLVGRDKKHMAFTCWT